MKIFIHIDMDCYYAQAEAKRLNIEPNLPLCARQWNSLIAINYPARDSGIQRGMLAHEAKKLCSQVLLPHVDTFSIINGQVVFSKLEDKFKDHNQNEEKISLQFFRDESKLIFEVLRNSFVQVEKGGCDEAYIQLTQEEIQNLNFKNYPLEFSGVVLGQNETQINDYTEEEQTLMRVSQWVSSVRKEIFEKTKYRCSAGIGLNKMLAKIGSSAYKPNNQTIIVPRFLPECIGQFKIGKIRGFGGKIKQAFKRSNIYEISQAQNLKLQDLIFIFEGDKDMANYIYAKIRGNDNEELKIQQDLKNKTIQSLKNFKVLNENQKQLLFPIIQLIIHDITMRIMDYYDDSGFVPSLLTAILFSTVSGQQTKSDQLNLALPEFTFKDSIEQTLMNILQQLPEKNIYPINHLGVSVRSFVPVKKSKLEFKFTINEYINKNSQQKQFQEMDQILNPQDYQECEECKENISLSQMNQHQDYHVAIMIDKSLNPNKKRYRQIDQTQEGIIHNSQKDQPQETKNQQVNKSIKIANSGTHKKKPSQSVNNILNYFQIKKSQ